MSELTVAEPKPADSVGLSSAAQDYALAEAQAGLWYAQRLDPSNPLFNTGHWLELRGPLNLDCFRDAVNQTVAEADTLSMAFREDATTGAVQCLDPQRTPRLQVIDLSERSDPKAAALALIGSDADTAVDPMHAAVALQRLYVLGPEHHLWYQRVHHLVIDGYGINLLNKRIEALYRAALTGQAAGPALSPLAAVFAEDQAYQQSDKRLADAAWWRDYLAGLPEVSGMAAGRAVSAHRFERSSQQLAPDLLQRLRQRAEQFNVQWPDLLTALTAVYCQRFIGGSEIVVGVPFMGRLGSASARTPAMVMNVLPLRVNIDPDQDMAEFVSSVAASLMRGRRHGRYRSEQMRRDLGLLGGHRRLYGPLINILPFEQPLQFEGLQSSLQILSTGPVDDLTLTFRGDGGQQLQLDIDINPALYTRSELEAHALRLPDFLDRALDRELDRALDRELGEQSACRCPGDIALATAAEAQHFIHTVNQTRHALPDTTLTALLEAGMQRWAALPALGFGDDRLTYAQLEQRTRALALQLRERGIGREDIVAIALPRSLELVIALLAVLRAGAAYLPLDPDHPPERIQKILSSAQPRLTLAIPEYRDLLQTQTHVQQQTPVLYVPDWSVTPAGDAQELAINEPGDLAYVIYTSGSTGDPKGVMIEHRAIVNRLEWMRQHYAFDSDDRILQKTPATFDVSVWEFFLPFISGASLRVAPPGAHRDPEALAGLIREYGITTAHFVPSMLAVFLDEPSVAGIQMRRVFCSGEELGTDLGARFHTLIDAELHNLYGPTEAAVDISYWPVAAGDTTRPVPIGFPVWNSRLYVLDDRLRPLPAGVSGHLYLAGVQLARGYLGRRDLTDERFVADPFVPGERMYHAGDLARWREDGAVVYLGRSDHQVKIRGLRIELGEIETAVMSSGLARQVSVIVREDQIGHKRLVAYLVPEAEYSAPALKTHLLALLPDYMVPAAFVALDMLPATSNGKLDRNALPAPAFVTVSGRAPETVTETVLAALYAEVLGLPTTVDADSDFFSLGGDSLMAVQLMLRIKRHFGRDPGLGALFDKPSVEGLASVIDADDTEVDNGLQPLIRLRTGDDARPPLFAVHPVGGISWCYRHLANLLSPARTVYGLQAPSLAAEAALPHSIDEVAADYAARMMEVCPQGPYHLVGWSVGGIIAQAIAVRLQALGQTVGVVAMFDSYPSECWRAEAEPTPAEALRALLAVAGYIPEDHPELVTREHIVDFLQQGNSALGSLPAPMLEGVIRVVLDINRLVRAHYHQPMQGTLLHFRAALDHQDSDLHPGLWQPYAETLEVVELPFLHSQLTGAQASVMIARELDARFGIFA